MSMPGCVQVGQDAVQEEAGGLFFQNHSVLTHSVQPGMRKVLDPHGRDWMNITLSG